MGLRAYLRDILDVNLEDSGCLDGQQAPRKNSFHLLLYDDGAIDREFDRIYGTEDPEFLDRSY